MPLPLAVTLAGILLAGLITFLYLKHTLDGPSALIVVVDRRTMLLAKTRIDKAVDDGDVARAYTGLTSMIIWLRYEVQVGPRRRRLEYARELEQAELLKDQLAPAIGLPGYEAR